MVPIIGNVFLFISTRLWASSTKVFSLVNELSLGLCSSECGLRPPSAAAPRRFVKMQSPGFHLRRFNKLPKDSNTHYSIRIILEVNTTPSTKQVLQFSSVSQPYMILCDPMKRRTPELPIHNQLPEFIQTHVHRVGDAIQPSHPLSSPSLPALNLSQHQGLFKWASSSHQVAKVSEFQLQHQSFQWTPRTDLL